MTRNRNHDRPEPAAAAARRRRWLYLGLFALVFFAYVYVHQYRMWNQHSRLDLLHAIFVHDTVKIDAYHDNTGDKAFFEGHYYSDKAPGITFLALPMFALSVAVLNAAGIHLDSPDGWQFSDWVATAGSVGLLGALGALAVFATLRRFVTERDALITTLVVSLGTGMFAYSTSLFSHAAVAALLAVALWVLLEPRARAPARDAGAPSSGTRWRDRVKGRLLSRETLAGLACGLAIASEFPAAIAVAGLLAFAAVRHFPRALHVGFASVPTLLLIPANNWITFGSPLTFGYSQNNVFPQMQQGLFGIGSPTWDGLYVLLVSPHRGLFFWSPFLLLALAGYVMLFRRSRALFALLLGVPVAHTVAMAGFYAPDGGVALGPRYLVLVLPFLAIPTALGFATFRTLGASLAALSLVFTGGATLITAQPPQAEADLLNGFYIPELRAQHFVPNLGFLVGLPGAWSIVPLLIVLGLGSRLLWTRLTVREPEAVRKPASASAPSSART